MLATDHAPHTLEEKGQGYEKAPSGLPLVQFVAAMRARALVRRPTAARGARRDSAHMRRRSCSTCSERGFIREGCWADLTLVDPAAPQTVTREAVISKCGWSPFEGTTFRSSVAATWINGHLAWNDG